MVLKEIGKKLSGGLKNIKDSYTLSKAQRAIINNPSKTYEERDRRLNAALDKTTSLTEEQKNKFLSETPEKVRQAQFEKAQQESIAKVERQAFYKEELKQAGITGQLKAKHLGKIQREKTLTTINKPKSSGVKGALKSFDTFLSKTGVAQGSAGIFNTSKTQANSITGSGQQLKAMTNPNRVNVIGSGLGGIGSGQGIFNTSKKNVGIFSSSPSIIQQVKKKSKKKSKKKRRNR